MGSGLWALQESVGEAARRAVESGEWDYLRERLSEVTIRASYFLRLLNEVGVKEPHWIGSIAGKIRESIRAGDASSAIDHISRLEREISARHSAVWGRIVATRLVRAGAGAALSLLSFKAYAALLEAGPLLLLSISFVASLGLASLLLIRTNYSSVLQAVAGLAAVIYSAPLVFSGLASSIYWPSLVAGLAGIMSFLYSRVHSREIGDEVVGGGTSWIRN
ncbi:MAG: hypothetical protein LRS43_00795 [Desulfurococcales archaeon]|nr:hypothetical protein [Desulfurococcales archaeon]